MQTKRQINESRLQFMSTESYFESRPSAWKSRLLHILLNPPSAGSLTHATSLPAHHSESCLSRSRGRGRNSSRKSHCHSRGISCT